MNREKREIPSSLSSLLLVICRFFQKMAGKRAERVHAVSASKMPAMRYSTGPQGLFHPEHFFKKSTPKSRGEVRPVGSKDNHRRKKRCQKREI